MFTNVQQTLLNNLFLKTTSLIIASLLWMLLSVDHKTSVTLTIPVLFYHTENLIIEAPETISVKISGLRKDFYRLARPLALHIDGNALKEGTQSLSVESSLLFLPETITLIKSTPQTCPIKVKTIIKE